MSSGGGIVRAHHLSMPVQAEYTGHRCPRILKGSVLIADLCYSTAAQEKATSCNRYWHFHIRSLS